VESLKNHVLSDWEWRLIARLREVPEGPLRSRLLELLDELVLFVREPRCPQVQGDGVPCAGIGVDCDECLHVSELLATLRARLQEL